MATLTKCAFLPAEQVTFRFVYSRHWRFWKKTLTNYSQTHKTHRKVCRYTPQKSNIDTKHGHILKESTFSTPSFRVSMLVFGDVICQLQEHAAPMFCSPSKVVRWRHPRGSRCFSKQPKIGAFQLQQKVRSRKLTPKPLFFHGPPLEVSVFFTERQVPSPSRLSKVSGLDLFLSWSKNPSVGRLLNPKPSKQLVTNSVSCTTHQHVIKLWAMISTQRNICITWDISGMG